MRHVAIAGLLVVSWMASLGSSTVLAGPYTEVGIPTASPLFKGWATGAVIERGPQNIANPGGALATVGTDASAIGIANNTVVSLGDGGRATLTFAMPIVDGPGADFAVFENGFTSGNALFAELAFVEVSSNGVDFIRFPSISLTPTTAQVGSFATVDPTNIHNLAGRHSGGQGTPFDLAELAGLSSLLDLSAVSYVRIVDVVGSINPGLGQKDSLGNLINDPYPTAFTSGGFDLDAVGIINVPEASNLGFAVMSILAMGYRNRRG